MSSEEIDINAEYFKLKRLGNEHFHSDEMDKAKECYQKAIDCSPPKEVLEILHVNLATIYSREPSDWDAVLKHTNLALEINPEDVRALFGRYRAYEAAHRYTEALDDITTICCLKIHDPMYMRTLDMAIVKVADLDAVDLIKHRAQSSRSKYNINAYFKTFSCDPVAQWWSGKSPFFKDPDSVLCKLFSQQSLEETETAGDTGDTKADLSGFTAAVWELHRQNYSKIMDLCTEELSNEDSKFKAEARLLRGTFRFFSSYSSHDILEDLDPLTSGSLPASVEIQTSAWLKRGELFTLTNQRDEMTQCFEAAQAISPDNPDVDSVYCQSLMESEQILEAYIQISKAVEKVPLNPGHLGILAFLKFRLDAMKGNAMAPIDALNMFESYIQKFPNCAELYIAFGHLYKDIREACAAYMIFRKACVLEPENFNFAVNKIMMKFETTADVNACLDELNEVLAMDETTVSAYEALATIHVSMGPNFDEAFVAIEKGLKVAKSRHDFLTFAILKKTAEVRQKIMASYETNRHAGYGRGRYDQFLVDSWDSSMD